MFSNITPMFTRIIPILLLAAPLMALNSFVITDQEQCGFPILPDYPNSSFIKVQSWIPEVSFKANLTIEAQIPKPKEGFIYLVVPAETSQRIKVNSPDFTQGEFRVDAMPEKNTRCIVIEPKSRSAIKGKGSLTLNTVPAGVSISVDGIPTFSEISPFTFDNWATGVQTLTLTKNRYQTVEVEIEIEKERPFPRPWHSSPTGAM